MTSLTHITVLACITTLAALFTLRRVLSFRLIFGYAVVFDLTFTVLMIAVFKGTVSGAASATLAGLLLAVVLTVGKLLAGYDRLHFKRKGWRIHVRSVRHEGLLERKAAALREEIDNRRRYQQRRASRNTLYRTA